MSYHYPCEKETYIYQVAEAINNPFGDDEDDFQICYLVSRHIWAVGNNLKQKQGPPPMSLEVDDNQENESEKHTFVEVENNRTETKA